MNPEPTQPHDIDQFVPILLEEQSRAWTEGRRVLVEDYCFRHPTLLTHSDALLDLVYNEVILREDIGETPELAEYQQRFPQLSDRLSDQFDVHRALRLTSGPTNTSTPVTVPPLTTTSPPPSITGYELLEKLGQGGMGIVYKARHHALNRVVALKMILAGVLADEQLLDRFGREGEAVASLQHPHIVQIFEVGKQNGLPFYSLEYCPGGSLDGKLADSPMLASEAALLTEQLAQAMYQAHQKGVIHRDLKPSNVLFAEDSSAKITDFGLAKKIDERGQTTTGAVMGTPSYMAPEQAQGKTTQLGPACDVYSLGAILYECLTGRPPFKAATTMDTLIQVVGEEPVPPTHLNAKIPVDLETICLKCLAKEPAQRYETALSLAEDLRRFQQMEPIVARPVSRVERLGRWCRRNPMLAATMASAVSILTIGILVSSLFGIRAAENAREALHAQNRSEEAARAEKKARRIAENERQRAKELAALEVQARLNAEAERKRAEASARLEETAARQALAQEKLAKFEQKKAESAAYALRILNAKLIVREGNLAESQHILNQSDPNLRGWEFDYLYRQTSRVPRNLRTKPMCSA